MNPRPLEPASDGHAPADLDDLDFHAWPPVASPGGQQVTDMRVGVLAIHRPTGIAVVCESECSRHANKAKAVAMLRAQLGIESDLERIRPVYEAAVKWRDADLFKLDDGAVALRDAVDVARSAP
jgi:hypothetical protein